MIYLRFKRWAARNEIALQKLANILGSILIGLLISASFLYQIYLDNWSK